MASMSGGRLKYLRNHVTMLEMTYEIDKWLIYVEIDVHMWEMAQVFEKLTYICGKWLKYLRNG